MQCALGVVVCRARLRVCPYEQQCFHHDSSLLFVINHSHVWCDLLSLHKSSVLPGQHRPASFFFTNHNHVVSTGSTKNSSTTMDRIQHRVCTDMHVSKTLPEGMLILPSQKRSLDSEALLARQILHAGPSRSVIRRGLNCLGTTVKAVECAEKPVNVVTSPPITICSGASRSTSIRVILASHWSPLNVQFFIFTPPCNL